MAGESMMAAPTSGPRVHEIGAGGIVVVAAEAADVRIQGVEGTEVRVVAPADGAGIATEAQPGRFTVRTLRRGETERIGFVGLKVGRREFGFPLGFRVSGTIEIEVPRDARVEVGVAAGDVAIRDVRGGAVVRTASGDVSIKGAGGHVAVNASSGDVNVIAGEPVVLEVHSIAGDVRARAPRFERVVIETISGDAELAGTFASAARHAVSTVSGDVELTVLSGGLAIEVKTVSGDLTCHHPDRREGDGRRRPLVIGDGAAQMSIRSMSGDVDVRAGRGAPPAPPAPVAPAIPAPPRSPAPPPIQPAAPWSAQPPADSDRPDTGTITILEALARGEIDVVEAERQLALATAPTVDAPDEERRDA